jgi:hypothetical protein
MFPAHVRNWIKIATGSASVLRLECPHDIAGQAIIGSIVQLLDLVTNRIDKPLAGGEAAA